MKRALGCCLLIIVLGVAPALSEDLGEAGKVLFDTDLSDRGAEVEGAFHQWKTLQDLDVTFESSGKFSFSREEGLHWEVREPVPTRLLITREQIVEIQDGEEVMRMSTDDQPATRVISELFYAMFTGDQVALERYFALRRTGSPDNWTVMLDPLEDSVGALVDSVELRGGDRVEELILQETNGDRTRIRLQDLNVVAP